MSNTIFAIYRNNPRTMPWQVIMRDKYTNRPRGFGFLTLDDEDAAAQICQDSHVLDGRQVSRLLAFVLGHYLANVASADQGQVQCIADRCQAVAATESEAKVAEVICGGPGS